MPSAPIGDAELVRSNVAGTQVAGKVSFLSPQRDPATGTVKVAAGNADGKLKPGM